MEVGKLKKYTVLFLASVTLLLVLASAEALRTGGKAYPPGTTKQKNIPVASEKAKLAQRGADTSFRDMCFKKCNGEKRGCDEKTCAGKTAFTLSNCKRDCKYKEQACKSLCVQQKRGMGLKPR